jgi:hypothetical protein
MQITVEIPDKIGKQFKKYSPSKRKQLVLNAITKEVGADNEDSLWAITELAGEVKQTDISENHDKYLTQDIISRKTHPLKK